MSVNSSILYRRREKVKAVTNTTCIRANNEMKNPKRREKKRRKTNVKCENLITMEGKNVTKTHGTLTMINFYEENNLCI